jgi:hypothetical protein
MDQDQDKCVHCGKDIDMEVERVLINLHDAMGEFLLIASPADLIQEVAEFMRVIFEDVDEVDGGIDNDLVKN